MKYGGSSSVFCPSPSVEIWIGGTMTRLLVERERLQARNKLPVRINRSFPVLFNIITNTEMIQIPHPGVRFLISLHKCMLILPPRTLSITITAAVLLDLQNII